MVYLPNTKAAILNDFQTQVLFQEEFRERRSPGNFFQIFKKFSYTNFQNFDLS